MAKQFKASSYTSAVSETFKWSAFSTFLVLVDLFTASGFTRKLRTLPLETIHDYLLLSPVSFESSDDTLRILLENNYVHVHKTFMQKQFVPAAQTCMMLKWLIDCDLSRQEEDTLIRLPCLVNMVRLFEDIAEQDSFMTLYVRVIAATLVSRSYVHRGVRASLLFGDSVRFAADTIGKWQLQTVFDGRRESVPNTVESNDNVGDYSPVRSTVVLKLTSNLFSALIAITYI